MSCSGTWSLPCRVKSWPTRSLPPVRAQVACESPASVPETTRSRLMRPLNWSASVLKQNAVTGPSSASAIVTASPEAMSTASRGAASAGEGSASVTRSSARLTPIAGAPAAQTTGKIRPSFTPARIAPISSSVVISSPSRYFSMRASSFSATTSMSASRAAWAWSARSSGIGPVLPVGEPAS